MADEQPEQNSPKQAGRWPRYAAWGVAGAGAAAALAGAFLVYRERSAEKPRYTVVETDGQFELRDYPEMIVAETVEQGVRDQALDAGFGVLADYIFARSRPGGRIAMTAPVVSTPAGDGAWRTIFMMPAHLTREQLPEPPAGITIATLPARRVAAIRFTGPVDDDVLAERSAQLRHWVGAKKLDVAGQVEHAFYNSPALPAGMRRTEVLLPIG